MSNSLAFKIPSPKERLLQVFAFDPSLNLSLDTAVINHLRLAIPWEDLGPGPVGEYLEVVDIDPSSGLFYPPLDLDEPYLLVQDGLNPSEATPQFHQQMVYAVASKTIQNFVRALGRKAQWSPRLETAPDGSSKENIIPRLRIYPHALREANAYYSPNKKAILFGYFPASTRDAGNNLPGGMVFTCLSHDIIAHEVTHALLDGLHPYFDEPSNVDVLALHEAFADIVALFQHFSYPQVLRHQIARTRGDLTSENLLGELAQQFGQAIGGRGALRSAIGAVDRATGQWKRTEPDPMRIQNTFEPHARGAILVAAVFDAFITVYKHRIADLVRIATGGSGILPKGALHPDLVNRLADEAAQAAQHILAMCIRALDYCPPVDITFGEYLRAIITADYDMAPSDPYGYRIAMVESFRRHGIYPANVRNLSEESLLWHPPADDGLLDRFFSNPERWAKIKNHEMFQRKSASDRAKSFLLEAGLRRIFQEWLTQEMQGTAEKSLGLILRQRPELRSIVLAGEQPFLEVNSVRPAYRSGEAGLAVADLVVEINQQRHGYLDPLAQARADKGRGKIAPPDFIFRGGATMLIDLETARVRYVVYKHVHSNNRLEIQRRYLSGENPNGGYTAPSLRATYFGDPRLNYFRLGKANIEPFALLHRSDPSEEAV
jgi:hypothetical protein